MKTRISHLWYLLSWILSTAFIVVVYHMITESDIFRFGPNVWTYIDQGYIALLGFFIILIITNIVSLIFHEVQYAFSMNYLMIRKFLPIIRFLVILVIWIIGSLIVLQTIGFNTNGLLAGAGIGGVMFALASKDLVANLLGSLSIIMSKTFEIGETIRVKNLEGIVEEINLNYTKIMSTDGKVVFMPNKVLNTEQLENLSRRRFYVYTFKIPFKKNSGNSEKVKDALMLIEGKIAEYSPIKVTITTEIPNANDLLYVISVNVPEENEEFEKDIQNFLIPYIFSPEK
ncbi:MAG: mechanosensitive ion channel [Candidatus Gracilibacteria bacterium]|nr:mechanosensitive ion channel [Candidatus Gracilibacteria bacterium]